MVEEKGSSLAPGNPVRTTVDLQDKSTEACIGRKGIDWRSGLCGDYRMEIDNLFFMLEGLMPSDPFMYEPNRSYMLLH